MSYQVLARKWRPRDFSSLVGQEHVVRALTHALKEQRLHHAYLFTGTRGVGKTTLARILAKALNCETGISPAPCGCCSTCLEIDSGRFVDYIEMDAASNRGVDDMTQLLEQAMYAPTRGRYKVYVIDEVHQLSGHAFNAMLKTLEEPPEHVKFILATTDPQKIPVTVLSRCLQFNLKQMPNAAVVDHLAAVLRSEGVEADSAALRLIATAGAGSMRDSLSLLDQAIAHGAGKVHETDVREMLGTVDTDQIFDILEALLADDPKALVDVADSLGTRSLSFEQALQELASCLVQVQVAQVSPSSIGEDNPWRERLLDLAARLDPDYVQLAYQIAIQGRQDLPFAPEATAGFTMTLLRLFAFRPESSANLHSGRLTPAEPAKVAPTPQSAVARPAAKVQKNTDVPAQEKISPQSLGEWRDLVQSLGLSGMVRELAQHCEAVGYADETLRLRLAPGHRHLLVKPSQDKLQVALSEMLKASVRLVIDLAEPAGETPATQEQRERRVQQDKAVAAIESDGFVRDVIDVFDATLIDSSIKPIG